MKLLFLQQGDFADAWRRLTAGGEENYRDQRASVEFVASLAERFDVTVVALSKAPHEVQLAPRLTSIALSPKASYSGALIMLLNERSPDLMICRTPHDRALRWAARTGTPTLPDFADFFAKGGARLSGLRTNLRLWRLGRTLRAPVFPCVVNHSLNASRSMIDALGLTPDRIVPRDRKKLPVAEPRTVGVAPGEAVTFFYAGGLKELKGAGDCIDALEMLRAEGQAARLSLAGRGDVDVWRKLVMDRGLEDVIDILGHVPNAEVKERLTAAHAMIVGSHRAYPEGLPNTLCEALAARTPVIASDHPSYSDRLVDGEDCLIFRAADPNSLAAAMRCIADEPELRARLSEAGAAAHDKLYIGMEWSDLVTAFIDDPRNETGWVGRNSLTALGL